MRTSEKRTQFLRRYSYRISDYYKTITMSKTLQSVLRMGNIIRISLQEEGTLTLNILYRNNISMMIGGRNLYLSVIMISMQWKGLRHCDHNSSVIIVTTSSLSIHSSLKQFLCLDMLLDTLSTYQQYHHSYVMKILVQGTHLLCRYI